MANKSTVIIDTKTAETLLREVESMRQSLEALRKKILKLLPAKYGSGVWWAKEINEGLKEVEKGKYMVYNNVKDLINDLHSGT